MFGMGTAAIGTILLISGVSTAGACVLCIGPFVSGVFYYGRNAETCNKKSPPTKGESEMISAQATQDTDTKKND